MSAVARGFPSKGQGGSSTVWVQITRPPPTQAHWTVGSRRSWAFWRGFAIMAVGQLPWSQTAGSPARSMPWRVGLWGSRVKSLTLRQYAKKPRLRGFICGQRFFAGGILLMHCRRESFASNRDAGQQKSQWGNPLASLFSYWCARRDSNSRPPGS